MPLASLDDVKRILRVSTVDEERDAQLRAALDAVEDWIAPQLAGLTAEGQQVEAFFDVYEDATLHMAARDATVLRVKVFYGPASADGIPQGYEMRLGSGYDLDNEGRIMLRPNLTFAPFEGALASRPLKMYSRVEVLYYSTGVVPKSITEAVALLTAGYWSEGPQLLQSISHEKIGDYEYWTNANADGAAPAAYTVRAMQFLNNRRRRNRVSVT